MFAQVAFAENRLEDDFSGSNEIWTEVLTAATLTRTGGELVFYKTSAGYTNGGMYLTDPVVGVAGMYFQFDVKHNDANTSFWHLLVQKTTPSVDALPGAGFVYSNSGTPGYALIKVNGIQKWDENIGTTNVYATIKYLIKSDGELEMYWDDVLKYTTVGWGSLIGENLYFSMTAYHVGPNRIMDNFVCYDPTYSTATDQPGSSMMDRRPRNGNNR